MQDVNLAEKQSPFSSHWNPHVAAQYNGNDVMVVKFAGEFPFHDHPDTEDFFPVPDSEVLLDVEDETHVLRPGEPFVVAKAVPNIGDPATAAKKPRL